MRQIIITLKDDITEQHAKVISQCIVLRHNCVIKSIECIERQTARRKRTEKQEKENAR
jgi:hypothetical protein